MAVAAGAVVVCLLLKVRVRALRLCATAGVCRRVDPGARAGSCGLPLRGGCHVKPPAPMLLHATPRLVEEEG